MPPGSEPVQAYGDALLTLCEAAGATVIVERQLDELLEFLVTHEAIGRFANDPTITAAGKLDALDRLLEEKLHGVLHHFILILVSQGLFRELPAIAQAFKQAVTEKREHATGELASAHPVPEEKVALIEKEVGRILSKRVQLRLRVDPGLLGGMVVRVGDFIIDGTVDRQLDSIRRGLLT